MKVITFLDEKEADQLKWQLRDENKEFVYQKIENKTSIFKDGLAQYIIRNTIYIISYDE